MSISSRIDALRESVPETVKIIAVSKFHPAETVMEAYRAGQHLFGENRVQELAAKYEVLPKDIEWHLIGSLQRNKVKYIAPFVSLIHSLDSERLMKEIAKQGAANNRVISCLLQIHIAQEETKSGFSMEECRRFLEEGHWRDCPHVRLDGVMGMATFTDDTEQIRKEFRQLKSFFDACKADYFADAPSFKEISMGMSDDYPIAIEEGATMIRVGTGIFSVRQR